MFKKILLKFNPLEKKLRSLAIAKSIDEISHYDSKIEKELIEKLSLGSAFDFERATLIASGLKTEMEVEEYSNKLDRFHDEFKEYKSTHPKLENEEFEQIHIARLIKNFFREKKPLKYNKYEYKITNTIDYYLSKKDGGFTGNCISLTALNTIFGLKENLDLTIADAPITETLDGHFLNYLYAFKTGPHFQKSLIQANIENVTDCLAYSKISNLREITFNQFIAMIYISKADMHPTDPIKAINELNKSIKICPTGQAYFNRGGYKMSFGFEKSGIEDREKGIQLMSEQRRKKDNGFEERQKKYFRNG